MTDEARPVQEAVAGTWVPACPVADVPEDGAVRVELDGLPVCLVRAQDQVYAIQDVCSHAEVPLSEGDVEGTTVECWLHGSRFDLTTGEPIGPPASVPVPVYDTTIEGETVLVRVPLES
jgi:3-phenylpropionate/trans-cinnamate dioxygenase ferredoxin component